MRPRRGTVAAREESTAMITTLTLDPSAIDQPVTAPPSSQPRPVPFPVEGVRIVDNALPNDVATAVHQALHLYGWTYGWLSNHMTEGIFGHWNRTFAGRAKDHRDDVTDDLRVPAIKTAWETIAAIIG